MYVKRYEDSDEKGPGWVALPSLHSGAHIACDGEDPR